MNNRVVTIIDKETHAEFFSELILPDVYAQLHKNELFLVGAIENTFPVGAAVWEIDAGLVRLLSIAVDPDHRRQGIATDLLRMSTNIIHQLDCYGIYALTFPEENEVNCLLSSFGMIKRTEESQYFRTDLGRLLQVPVMKSNSMHTLPLKELSDYQYHSFINLTFSSNPSLWDRQLFDCDCSRVILEKNSVLCCILIEKLQNELSVAWLHSQGGKPEYLLHLFRDALAAGSRKYPHDTTISFTCYSELLNAIIKKLLGDATEAATVNRWELTDLMFRKALFPDLLQGREND